MFYRSASSRWSREKEVPHHSHLQRTIRVGRTMSAISSSIHASKANAGDQRAEMARVILITGKNRNAISAPLHRFVRRAFAFVWFTGIGRIAGEIRCSRRFQILACRDRDFGGHVSFGRFFFVYSVCSACVDVIDEDIIVPRIFGGYQSREARL